MGIANRRWRQGYNLWLVIALLLGAIVWLPRLSLAQTLTPLGTADSSAQITSPSAGQTLFGIVRVVGTASNAQMQQYQIDFLAAADPRAQWQSIASQVTQQITNGTLGQWDTSKLADGTYQLRLRVVLRNGTVLETFARGLIVSNQQPTPLPTFPPPPTATGLPTAGPSPTALIQQPPTATVAAINAGVALTPVPPTSLPLSTGDASASAGATLSLGAIQSALCSGALLALAAFALGGAYVFVRTRLRRS